MPTRAEYQALLLPVLTQRLAPLASASLTAAPASVFSVAKLTAEISGILELIEREHVGASAHVRGLLAGQRPPPWDGHGELAFLLYHLHHPPAALRTEIDRIPELRAVWDAMAAVAAPTPFTPASFATLAASLPKQETVWCNFWGDVYGDGTYEQLDPKWAWTLKNDLMNHLPSWLPGCGVAPFVAREWNDAVPLAAGADGKVRVAILGDWGTGSYRLSGLPQPDGPALAVMDTLARLDPVPDYIVHLGDTYYSGTDAKRSPDLEEAHNLVEVLKRYPQVARSGRCFTLNSNHEMYGGAWGYYGVALADPLFRAQQGCSYFAIQFGNCILAGLDSAYHDPSNLYMEGGLGDRSEPQYAFLRRLAAWQKAGKKIVLLSHHPGISTDGKAASKYLWNDVTSVLKPDMWYWGHTHLGAVYGSAAFSGAMKTRCIGHSAVPFAIPPGMRDVPKSVAAWYSHTALTDDTMLEALFYESRRAKNGFAVLTLTPDGITEAVYDIGNTEPVWTS